MAIEHPHHTGLRRAPRPSGPATLDVRERELADTIRHHVLLRDACLAPTHLVSGKLGRLQHLPVPATSEPERDPSWTECVAHGPMTVVARMAAVRRAVRDTGALLTCERRRLVLLEVLASTPESPEPGEPWSRSPIALIGEAAAGIGYSPSDIRRLARRLDVARRALPPVEIGPSTTRALAESLRDVTGVTPGAAVAEAVLLLSDRVPSDWTPSGCGGVLLDPCPRDTVRFLGTWVAHHDLSAFVDDLATLRVAADVSPTVRRFADVMLPELAVDLRLAATTMMDPEVLVTAAGLADRTTSLLSRGFRRFDRSRPGRHFHLAA